MRILVAEDDRGLALFLKKALKEEQYSVDLCHDGGEALFLGESNPYDLIILDIMLPVKNGFAVCRELRALGINIPILMLTARGQIKDRVKGLEEGADDYLSKPFAVEELMARSRALLRRNQEYRGKILMVGDLKMDPVSRMVTREDRPISLTGKEYALLEFLMRNRGRVVTHTQILEHIWDMDYDGLSNIVNVYINYLRDKIDRGFPVRYIHTLRGVGYKLDDKNED